MHLLSSPDLSSADAVVSVREIFPDCSGWRFNPAAVKHSCGHILMWRKTDTKALSVWHIEANNCHNWLTSVFYPKASICTIMLWWNVNDVLCPLQIPQWCAEFCLSAQYQHGVVVCSQIQRQQAVDLALRVADEMDINIGHEIGYSIPLETCCSSDTILRSVWNSHACRPQSVKNRTELPKVMF